MNLLRPLFLAALLGVPALHAEDSKNVFVAAPEHEEKADVPHGTLTKFDNWQCKAFPGTVRTWWTYVPAQYKAEKPAALMVFQDGHDYVGPKGNWRVPTVFDNLIAKGEMPVTIAVFINPGNDATKPMPQSAWKVSNRSFEYDSLGPRYASMLIDEIIPEVKKTHAITDNPEGRAICGESSGAICAFTVAWERPDQFRKVFSTIGSFTNIRGGNVYQALIRETERKPIRIFLQDSTVDLDNPIGNWPIANQNMFSSLTYMHYDVKFDFTEGYGHNSNRGGSIFPEVLRWLWRGYAP